MCQDGGANSIYGATTPEESKCGKKPQQFAQNAAQLASWGEARGATETLDLASLRCAEGVRSLDEARR